MVDINAQSNEKPPIDRCQSELAQAVWDQQPRPSARSVAQALTLAGRRVHFTTVARWRNQAWRSSETGQHPLDAARKALDAVSPLLTGNPLTKVSDLMATNDEREELIGLSDQDLLSDAIRETSIALIVVMHEIQRGAPDLVGTRPAEFGALLTAVARCLKAKELASAELFALQAPSA